KRQPMNCGDIQEIAPLWLSGELDPTRSAQVRAHLDGCAECVRSMREDEWLDERIRATLADNEPAAAQIQGVVRKRIAAERRARWLAATGVAAALLLSVFFGMPLLVRQQPGKLFVDAARDHQVEVMEHRPRR